MKFANGAYAVAAVLLFGTLVPINAQHEGESAKQEKGGHTQQPPPQQKQGVQQPKAKQPQRAQQPQPAPQQRTQQAAPQPAQSAQQAAPPKPQPQQQAQRPQQARQPAQPQRTPAQAKSWQQQRGWQQGGGWQGHDTWQQDRAQKWSNDHRTWAQRGGYGGSYIPQVSFNLHFGSEHFFRLNIRPVMYLGYPRFEDGGYSFLLVDPYPEYWADNWYNADDLYIGYDDGYYLYNRSYPQVRLAVTIVS